MDFTNIQKRIRPTLSYVLPVLALASTFVIVGVAMFNNSQVQMKLEIQDHLRTTAAVSAGQFVSSELDRIGGYEDLDSPLLLSIVNRLEALKETIPNARYVYLMRQTKDPNQLEFIADNDTLKPTETLDANHNGILEDNEEPSWPGDPYDVTNIPALRVDAFKGPAVDADAVGDQWGDFFSGYAPIRRSNGSVAAVIGIDIEASDYERLISQVFSPVAMLLFILMGLAFSLYFLYLFFERRDDLTRRLHDIRTGILQLTFHQLGSPLTAFKWSLEMLKEHEAKKVPDEVIQEHIHVMEEGIAFMMHLTNDLQQADQIRSGSLVYDSKSEDLSALIKEIAAEYQPRAVRKDQTIKLEIPESLTLPFDRRLISAVLRELLDNALIYSDSKTAVSIRLHAKGNFAEVSVADQGIGIPSDEFDRVFVEFGRASNAGKAHPSGSGLALFIAKGIVERAGGAMSLQSIENTGSVFTFTLPLTPVA